MPANAHVIDVDDGTFPRAVLAESAQRPVIVDFWAPWCGPCRALSPVLEKLAAEGEGRFLLAKVNTDGSSRFAGEFGVRGIPAVFAVVNGEVVDSFTGAIGEREVRAFLERVAPSPVERAAKAGLEALASQDDTRARALLDEVRAAKPADARALVGLALIAARGGQLEEARALLDACRSVPEALRGLATRARALIEGAGGDVDAARAAVESVPADVDAILALAALLYARGVASEAFDVLLAGIRHVKGSRRDELRKRLVELFDAEGPRTPLVEEARSRLAQLWFS